MDATILIVDDDAEIRESLHEFLNLAGYKARVVLSAEDALKSLKNNKFDVVITDIEMPGMNGLALTDMVKQNYNTDVIVITGYSDRYSYEEAINKGASDFVFKPVRFAELHLRLKRVLKERSLKKERAKMLKKLKKLAITDGLTKLFNSRHFYNEIGLEIDRANRYSHPLGLMLLDIDNFKKYNDTFGHLEGDKILVKLCSVIKSHLRTMDSAYRYGGEEFTIILPETNVEEAKTAALRIKNAIQSEKFYPGHGKTVTVTISIGVTQYRPEEELSEFIKRADVAMFISKEKGRNRVSAL